MDVLKFCDQDKAEAASKSNNNQKTASQYLTLSKKDLRGCTFIYKPLCDVNGIPYRRIKNPLSLCINTPDANGNLKWRTYSIYKDAGEYGKLTPQEQQLHETAKNLMIEVGEWENGDGTPYLRQNAVNVVFYAYALQLITESGENKLQNKGFTIVNHTSTAFLDSFHKVRSTKNTVMGTGAWLSDYFSIEKPSHHVIIKTENNVKTGIGMAVTVDFMERVPIVSVDEVRAKNPGASEAELIELSKQASIEELKKASENCKDLMEYSVKAAFDPQYFQEIINVCNDWKKSKLAEKATHPVESNLTKMQTEIGTGSAGDIGTPVKGYNQPEGAEPPPPTAQMNV